MGREPINAWVPLFIHPQHWKLVFPQLKVPTRTTPHERTNHALRRGGGREKKRTKAIVSESDSPYGGRRPQGVMGYLATLDPLGYNPNQVDLFYMILATMVSRLSSTPGTHPLPLDTRPHDTHDTHDTQHDTRCV